MPGIAILGVTGRMGAALVAAIDAQDDLRLVGAATRAGNAAIGRPAGTLAGIAGGPLITADADDALSRAAVAIDFSLPAATAVHARACVRAGCALVIGTTGLDAEAESALSELAAVQPVVYAANTSVGVTLALHLAQVAAAALGEQYDASIVETHHRGKVDAPSGTALALGRAVAAGRGRCFAEVADIEAGSAAGPREPGRIGFASVRAGDIVGDHRLLFAADGEVLEIAHRATSRSVFAKGALRAARWVEGRPPGLYGMADVLGLTAPG